MRRFTILVVLVLLLTSIAPLSPATFAESNNAPIRLKVATFHPGLGQKPELPPGLTIASPPRGVPTYYLVQFEGPIQPAWKEDLAALGAEIAEYIPEFAFKVRMTPDIAGRARRLDAVTWVGIFQPAYKISPALEDTAGLLRVDLTAAADAAAVRAEIAALGGTVTKGGGRSLTVQLDPQQLPALAHLTEVAWIEAEPEYEFYNNIARLGGGGMDAYPMWNLGIFGAGQIAAAADTGLDTNNVSTVHRDFRGRVIQIDILGSLATDTNGHGTHTSGSILGNGTESGTNAEAHDYGQYDTTDPNQTSTKITGVAPEAQFYFQAIASRRGNQTTLGGLPSDLNQLFLPPYNAGARIHSNSWGSSVAGAYTTSSQDVDEFMWNHPGMLVTTSAGNAGIDANNDGWVDDDSMGAPATAKNVLAVGATENARTNGGVNSEDGTNDIDEVQCTSGVEWGDCWPTDFNAAPTGTDPIGGTNNHDQMAAFSSRGPTDDGRIKPDVVAPGTNILSVKSSYASDCGWGPGPDGYYCMMGGTSMANPLTAGAAVLVQDWYEDIKGHADPSAALVKATLINTAVDIAGYENPSREAGLPIPNNHEGWGRVNLANVAADGREFYDGASLGTGGTATYTFDVAGGQPFKATLVWSDYPASTTASKALVNDLNLVVTGPSATYKGNVFGGGWSQTGGSADTINNVENVYVQSAGAGTWTVTVSGYNVPYGPQPFALVLDGGGSSGGENQPPTAAFTYNCTELACDFTDQSADSDGAVVSWSWDFGDGNTSTDQNPSHTYAADGTYTVTLTVTDDEAATDDDSQSVPVTSGAQNLPPTASFTYACTDLACDFTDQSTDTDGHITAWSWDFGDGATASGATASHTYAAGATYNVTLTVTDDDAATDDDTKAVTVTGGAGGDSMHVSAIDMWYTRAGVNYIVYTTVTIVDEAGNPVSNATVSVQVAVPGSSTATGSAATGADGTVTFNVKSKKTGTYTSTVTNVTHATLTYNPDANVETSESLSVP